MSHFAWDDRFLVGHATIDAEHREFALAVDRLLGATGAELGAALDAFASHAAAHFGAEERLMRDHAFPAHECHAAEHARVLASVHEVRQLVALGDTTIGRELALALIDWFPGHSDQMDSAVAIWVTKRITGGAPVVLRRLNLSSSAPSPLPRQV
jgi:hemerythrin